jgi:hypothetical protein
MLINYNPNTAVETGKQDSEVDGKFGEGIWKRRIEGPHENSCSSLVNSRRQTKAPHFYVEHGRGCLPIMHGLARALLLAHLRSFGACRLKHFEAKTSSGT